MINKVVIPWVVNSSPLISLGNIGQLSLLSRLATQVIVVPAVVKEVLYAKDMASDALQKALADSQLEEAKTAMFDPTVALWGLGPGETEVLSFARQFADHKCEAILDDRAARQCARSFNIPTRGTLGIVLLAKQRGIIPRASVVIEALQTTGLFLTPILVEQALSLVDESPSD